MSREARGQPNHQDPGGTRPASWWGGRRGLAVLGLATRTRTLKPFITAHARFAGSSVLFVRKQRERFIGAVLVAEAKPEVPSGGDAAMSSRASGEL